MKRRWPDAVRHPCTQHRLAHYAGIDILKPMIPPSQRLLQKADLRARQPNVRIGMCPGADQALARYCQMREQARNGIRIAVGPAADSVNRASECAVVLAYRAVLPIVVSPLVV